MNLASIAKNEYLKKYLSGSAKPDKKKKKKHGQIKGTGMKIIDDDVDLSKMRALEEDELDFLGGGEDAPQVAGIVDDRPAEVKRLEQFSREKWKVINEDDGFNSTLTVQQLSTNNERSPSPDSDQSVTRTKVKEEIIRSPSPDSDQSVPRTKRKEDLKGRVQSNRKEGKRSSSADSDQSVPRTKRKKESRAVSNKKDKKRSPSPDSDQPVPRTKRKEEVREKKRGPSPDSDLSVSRKKRKDVRGKERVDRKRSPSPDSDQSVPRTKRKEVRGKVSIKVERNRSPTPDSDQSAPRKIKEGVRVRERTYKKKSRWADPDEELGQQILESINRNEDGRGDRNEDRRRDRNEDKRGDRNEVRRGDRIEDRRGDRNEERWGDRNEDRRGDRNQDRRGDGNEDRRGDGNEDRRGDRNEDRRGDRNQDRYPKNDSNNREDNTGSRDRRNDRSARNIDGGRERGAEDRVPKLMEKTLDGKRAGLQDARQLKEENQKFRKKEAELFENLSEELSGRNAKTIKRDLKGKRETEEDRQNQRDKEEKDKEMEAKYSQWGKGLKQVEDQAANLRDYVHEASKPLARHRDDRDLENALRQKERDGDPMLEYMRRKETEKAIQDGVPARPAYKGPYPPNRFDIRPGHRWDGVDRSNGHEAAVFQARSSKKAMDSEQYKWSTEDM